MPPILPKEEAASAAGVDEAGRGCLAGPVVAAAVVLPPYARLPGLTDSKLIAPQERARLEPLVKARATAWCVGVVWMDDIERYNILGASLRAMAKAVSRLKTRPERLLVDGNRAIPEHLVDCIPQSLVVDGDRKVRAISAASILAKTFRDRIMAKLDARYPGYGFAAHKGYATRDHYAALERLGPCRIHRKGFRGVAPEPKETARNLWLLDT